MRRAIAAGVGVAVLGAATIAFAVQIRTWHGPGSWVGDPSGKVFITGWLASQLWVNPWLLIIGGLELITAVVIVLRAPRTR